MNFACIRAFDLNWLPKCILCEGAATRVVEVEEEGPFADRCTSTPTQGTTTAPVAHPGPFPTVVKAPKHRQPGERPPITGGHRSHALESQSSPVRRRTTSSAATNLFRSNGALVYPQSLAPSHALAPSAALLLLCCPHTEIIQALHSTRPAGSPPSHEPRGPPLHPRAAAPREHPCMPLYIRTSSSPPHPVTHAHTLTTPLPATVVPYSQP